MWLWLAGSFDVAGSSLEFELVTVVLLNEWICREYLMTSNKPNQVVVVGFINAFQQQQ